MAFPTPTEAQMRTWNQAYFYIQFQALESIFDAIVANTPETGLATEATLEAFKIQNDSNLDDVIASLLLIQNSTDETADRLLDADAVSAGANLRTINRNTRDWDNSGLTLAQMTLAIYGRFTGTCTGQSGAAVSHGGNVASYQLASDAIAAKINERKGNQAVVYVVAQGISPMKADTTYDWYCIIIG